MNIRNEINNFIDRVHSNNFLYAIKNIGKKKDYDYYKNLDESKYVEELMEIYYSRKKEKLDLKNPKTIDQKIQWLKLYDCTDLKKLLCDKYLARDWIEKNIGAKYLTPIYGIYDSIDEIDFKKLPKKFVLKCNHGSGFSKVVMNKDSLNIEETKNQFEQWMNYDYAYHGLEMQYKGIKPKILCEKYIGKDLIDIQVWCSGSDIIFISYIDSPHGVNKKATYDEEWNRLNFYTSLPILEDDIKKPKQLAEIKRVAKKIGKNFKFARVDFYITNKDELLISEITFNPASGCHKWVPKETDFMLRDKIKLD